MITTITFVHSMSKTKKIIHITLILISIVFFSFYRDFVFKSINALLQAWDYDMDYPIHPTLSFLKKYEYSTVYNFKWFLTLFFSGIFLFLLIWTIKVLFNNKRYRTVAILSYLIITILSALFMFVGYIFTDLAEKMYEASRFLMGMAQSPIILMILIPLFLLSEKEKMNKKA